MSQDDERKFGICAYVAISVLINIILLEMYLKAIHWHELKCYVRDGCDDMHHDFGKLMNIWMVNDRADELLIIATRHTIVIGMFVIFGNVLLLIRIGILLMVQWESFWFALKRIKSYRKNFSHQSNNFNVFILVGINWLKYKQQNKSACGRCKCCRDWMALSHVLIIVALCLSR